MGEVVERLREWTAIARAAITTDVEMTNIRIILSVTMVISRIVRIDIVII